MYPTYLFSSDEIPGKMHRSPIKEKGRDVPDIYWAKASVRTEARITTIV